MHWTLAVMKKRQANVARRSEHEEKIADDMIRWNRLDIRIHTRPLFKLGSKGYSGLDDGECEESKDM